MLVNKGDSRKHRNTPAVTRVAAWIRALTGVGPSIEVGSQVCKPNWADLAIAEPRIRTAIKVVISKEELTKLIVVRFREAKLCHRR